MLEPGHQVAGYRIDSVLGHGGMGIVYEATQLALQRKVALKVLAPQLGGDEHFRDRFRREGQIQAAIDHPNIVTVYEAGESEHGLFLAMRLIRGLTLKDMIIGRELEGARTLRILRAIADAVDAAHEVGLIHRDIKPQNILVGVRDHAYLADFGLTKGINDAGMTRTGQFVGTTDYISPEQIRGEQATAASDIYSLAAVLFECLTGVVPYPKPSDAAVLYAHLGEPPPLVTDQRPELPPALDDVIARAMAKDVAVRHPTATEMIEDAERGFGRRVRAVITPPGPIELPEEAGIRDPEHKVPTRPTRVRQVGEAAPPLAPMEEAAGDAEPAPPLAPVAEPAGDAEPAPPLAPVAEPAGDAEPAPAAPQTATAAAPATTPPPAAETAAAAAKPPAAETATAAASVAAGESTPDVLESAARVPETATAAAAPAPTPEITAPRTVTRAVPAEAGPANGAAAPLPETTQRRVAEPVVERRPETAPVATAEPAGRRRRAAGPAVLAGTLAGVALVAAAAGFMLGHRGGPSVSQPTQLGAVAAGRDARVRVPVGWRTAVPATAVPGLAFAHPATATPPDGAGTLEAGTVTGGGPTLLPGALLARLPEQPHPTDRVGLGRLVAYRYARLRPRGLARPVTVYVTPTTAGVLAVACVLPSTGAAAFAQNCERAAETLLPLHGAPLALGASRAYAARVNRAVGGLARARRSGRARLAHASTPAAQAVAAATLAGAYGRAWSALAHVRATPADAAAHRALAASLAHAQAAYRRLAAAARRHRARAYTGAARGVEAAERRIEQATGTFRGLGYVVR